ncbi:macrolide ABC transporter ATP-binding protein [Candidatus Pacearchaeota archaeon]|nr:MAG: macrolide ABC transporter ATP-binding protein [Candidatus Pacearchaeota archaeon]
MNDFIFLSNISKIYSSGKVKVQALDNVFLKVDKGEFVAIMGPSGSGKSTLLHIIGFLDKPTSGKYFFQGEDTSNFDEDKLSFLRNRFIGFVFQFFNLLPRLNAFENVELPLIYAGISKKERKKRVEEVLEKVNIIHRANHRPSELSGGEQQRVAIARALVTGAEIILADEPTGNLDTKTGEEIMKLFKKLNDEGKTIIVVTHDPKVASFADRIIKIIDGKIVEHG